MDNIGRADVAGASIGATEDEAPLTVAAAQGFRAETKSNAVDCAAKLIATVTARAALLGIEVRPIDADTWLLRHARGADIGIVRGLAALDAAVAGFEAAQRDVAELVRRLGGAR